MLIYVVVGGFDYESSDQILGVFDNLEAAEAIANENTFFESAAISVGELNSTEYKFVKSVRATGEVYYTS